jgi:hypothetical protein
MKIDTTTSSKNGRTQYLVFLRDAFARLVVVKNAVSCGFGTKRA